MTTEPPADAGTPPLPVPAPPVFSYGARAVAFSVYLLAMLGPRIPSSLMKPLMPSGSRAAVARFSLTFTIIYSLLALALALWTLRVWTGRSSTLRPTLRGTLAELGLRTRNFVSDVVMGLGGYVISLPYLFVALGISAWLFHRYKTPDNPVFRLVPHLNSPLDRGLLFLAVAVVAPIVEETMFRGVLYPALRARWGVPAGVALSAGVFAIVHPNLPSGFLPIWTIGVALALLYERRQSLLPGMVFHGLNNALILLFTLWAHPK